MMTRTLPLMKGSRLALVSVSLTLASCGEPPPPPKPPLEAELVVPASPKDASRTLPKGAKVEPSGFGTLLSAPPTDYEPPPPPAQVGRDTPAAQEGPVVAPEIAHLIRLLPRVRPKPITDGGMLRTLEAPPIAKATIILRDGCFRLNAPGEPLVLFTVGVRAFLDGEGYVAVGPADFPPFLSGRVGEPLRWEGPIEPVSEQPIIEPINRICGPGRVVRIGLASSEAAQTNVEDASTAREISQRYGSPYPEARQEVRACRQKVNRRWAELRARYGDRGPPVELLPGNCILTPPLPVARPADCPAGTTLEGGLCRGADGHVVPVPPRRPLG